MWGIDRARSILKDLISVGTESELVATAAHELALIEYAKPFKKSFGEHQGYLLSEPDVSIGQLRLHHEILQLRDQVLAHSDLTVQETEFHLAEVRENRSITVISNVEEPLPRLTDTIELIDSVTEKLFNQLSDLKKSLGVEP
jgi:hypothetical protein